MKEFSLIESLTHMLDNSGIALGVGDDAALFGTTLIAKDIMAENVHFTPDAPFSHIMQKLITANVSDIAAMGGVAKYALLGIAVPEGREVSAEDIAKPFDAYGLKLIGGDTTSSAGGLFVSLTVIGERNEYVLKRSGAKAGDMLFLSRPAGRVRQLLDRELAGNTENYNHYLVRAETALGDFLGRTGIANSCIDVSDGIGRDASHIAQQSGVKIVVESAKVLCDGYSAEYALGSGEEFSLLFTVPADRVAELTAAYPAVICIGRVEEGSGVWLEKDGSLVDISNIGYEHHF
ncbi:thiamine-phosphate kinase [Seleniivibrio woodruffii]|uniref:Thiamine-monophosphate kinase n=1 Tax=Seleniivibrio woodruffii TaxID=1078050 RepID=A0A4R1KBH3_9BACT|nr:thiamine-phosphate kinase [Seleniivibrio woodruffii]TCK61804.1 thiamine-phosphate kinase [Seleniivibrio woodruffii]TVZ35081.1 thiamine-monophosphate kinase [Seleniivibrio woodruffii]